MADNMTPPRLGRPAGTASGDEVARLVLKLVEGIAQDRRRPPLDPIGPSPVYEEFERLTGRSGPGGGAVVELQAGHDSGDAA